MYGRDLRLEERASVNLRRDVLFAIVPFAACSRGAYAAVKTNPPMLVAAYAISRAFGSNAVFMTATQRAWIERILRSKTYKYERSMLYFADVPDQGRPLSFASTLSSARLAP